MGKTQTCSNQRRYRHLIISMFLLLGPMLLFHAEGRAMLGAKIEPEGGVELRGGGGVVEEERIETERARRWLIGSSPPRCERRCSSCRRCEAVQVPIVPQQQRARGISRLFANVASARIPNSRGGDDISNYKPMAWKCKCGDLLFNP
ncbi:hypothetical protein CDL15_Pgr014461 [Punica granatum]|nr:hypothetical protein CDL15_Pgr014461 [Punica granatum]PKI55576.1 hypothetical protein CRG98_024024 [Punica granatum]